MNTRVEVNMMKAVIIKQLKNQTIISNNHNHNNSNNDNNSNLYDIMKMMESWKQRNAIWREQEKRKKKI